MLTRWLSAIGGLILLFGTLWVAGPIGLAVVGSIGVLIAAWEYAALFEKPSAWFFMFLVADAIVYLLHILHPTFTVATLAGNFVIMSALGVVMFRDRDPKEIFGKIQWTLWGVIYTGLFPALTVQTLITQGWIPLFYLLVTVFFGDVAAFFCGKYIGGPKIFPNISPKKTVSGAAGGLVASAVCGTLFLIYFGHFPNISVAIPMSLAIGLFGQFGDFFESAIKRVSGCKDSGQIMPGHGGLLDRLDGVYFGSAMFYVFCITLDYISYF
jgi:phosphatidate cytidylyltransferase